MTDEEMAEEYCNEEVPFETAENGEKLYTENDLKCAYLAGLKADKDMNVLIKWHDLRKDPNDLPESYMSVVNQYGEKVMYDYSCEVWRCDDADEYICDTPIAWCEIPKYKEE